jgi:acyl transferase domain-containing protein/acyl carrier protein
MDNEPTGFEIAIIGMSGRFPGARNIDEYWQNLKNGIETVSYFSDEELENASVPKELYRSDDYVRARGILQNSDCFDASFFGYTHKEAQLMEPQIRLFHECVWWALEDAGYNAQTYNGLIGIFAGANMAFEWAILSVLSGRVNEFGSFAALLLANKDFLCTRISYKLNLAGPSLSVHSACSTSLVAIHTACQAVINGECDMALAGGVGLINFDTHGYFFEEGMTLSPDGHCRTFDARAKGTVTGEGVGALVLKRLADADADGDHIYAVIKGSAINNDGVRKVGFTAPSIEGQAEVIRAAMQMSEVDVESIGYVEAHGTATELGDPVEFEALKLAFNSDKKGFCGIGSVKSNFGHLDSAAGVAGIIKTILAIQHRLIPPSLHFESPNPKIDLNQSPFYINTVAKSWEPPGYPIRAGVSSFGIGGTNAHVILEEAPKPRQSSKSRDFQLILLSAHTKTALETLAKNYATYLSHNPATSLTEFAYTLKVGRQPQGYRRKFVCTTTQDAYDILCSDDSRKNKVLKTRDNPGDIVFMFPGLGSQYVNMGRDLYLSEPLFKQVVDDCFALLTSLGQPGFKEILYPENVTGDASEIQSLDAIQNAQLALFIFEYALASLVMSWGIQPDAMIGYSIGEYTAACFSGVLSLEDTLSLLITRGNLIKKLGTGSMLSVPLKIDELRQAMTKFAAQHQLQPDDLNISIAIDNGPSCVVSGEVQKVLAFEQFMKQERVICIPVKNAYPIHSKMMEPILADFKQAVSQCSLNPPRIPFLSNVTGTWANETLVTDPGYWSDHLRQTVRFSEGVQRVLENKRVIFLEVGPDRELCNMVSNQLTNPDDQHLVSLVRHVRSDTHDLKFLLNRVGQLWTLGVTIDWHAFYRDEIRNRISIPGYPFEGKPYGIDRKLLYGGSSVAKQPNDPLMIKKPDVKDWFYQPSWVQETLTEMPPENPQSKKYLLFCHPDAFPQALKSKLMQQGHLVVTVLSGLDFSRSPANDFVIRPNVENDYLRLFKELEKEDRLPRHIIHAWSIQTPPANHSSLHEQVMTSALDHGFYSLVYLSRVLGKTPAIGELDLDVLSCDLYDITGLEELSIASSPILGPLKVIPQEYTFIHCRNVDIQTGDYDRQPTHLLDSLVRQFNIPGSGTVVAYRNNYRWVQRFQPLPLAEIQSNQSILREKGVYLITGGLGRIGLSLAHYLVQTAHARVILISRTPMPPKETWDQVIHASAVENTVAKKIKYLMQLESMGGEILCLSADVSDKDAMNKALAQAEDTFGPVNGVIHAAGYTGSSVMKALDQLSENDSQLQLRPKILGLLTLADIIKDRPMDFCYLTSSLSPILGGLGLTAYAAGNHFMDAYVYRLNRSRKMRWISVNWADWEFANNFELQPADTQNNSWRMNPSEGIETFHRIINHTQVERVVVSTVDLQDRIDRWIKLEDLRKQEEEKSGDDAYTLKARPELDSDYVKPTAHLDQIIAGLLEDFLGIDMIGVDDNFFELGATSMSIIQINGKLRDQLKRDISVVLWFEYPTISLLTNYLAQENTADNNAGDEVIDRTEVIDRGINKLRQMRNTSRD